MESLYIVLLIYLVREPERYQEKRNISKKYSWICNSSAVAASGKSGNKTCDR